MGLFDNYDNTVSVSVRSDDAPGVYWQRINDATIETSQKGQEYLKLYKTTVKVLDQPWGPGNNVGADTTQVFFRDKRYTYFEKDTKRLVMHALGVSEEVADTELTGEKIAELIKNKDLNGRFIKVTARNLVKTDANGNPIAQDKPKVIHTIDGHVSADMIATLPDDVRNSLGL